MKLQNTRAWSTKDIPRSKTCGARLTAWSIPFSSLAKNWQSWFYNLWLHGNYVSSLFCFTPEGRIRACLFNAPETIHYFNVVPRDVDEKINNCFEKTGGQIVICFQGKRFRFIPEKLRSKQTTMVPQQQICRCSQRSTAFRVEHASIPSFFSISTILHSLWRKRWEEVDSSVGNTPFQLSCINSWSK